MQYLRNFGLALDRFLNALLLAGSPQDTISIHSANSRNAGKRWGCILCKWFDLTIEKNHCDLALTNESTKPAASVRALIQLIAIVLILWALQWLFLIN